MTEPTAIIARRAMGPKIEGEALVAHDGFSARYDLDRAKGVFSRPSHALYGESYVGKILVVDKAKGGVASAWMLHEMVKAGMAPLALVMNHVNPVIAQGAALAGMALLDGFDDDITGRIKTGQRLAIDPADRSVTLLP